MALYLVAYDLVRQGQNYTCIINKLEALGTYFHIQQSVWLVGWDGDAYALATHLEGCLDGNDKLFVTRATPDSAWTGYDDDGTQWIQSQL